MVVFIWATIFHAKEPSTNESGPHLIDIVHDRNSSLGTIEDITTPCGRISGKMGHSERAGSKDAKNIPGNKHQPIFTAGVRYFD